MELQGREVHRHGHGRQAGIEPGPGLATGFLDHPGAHGHDQARLFRQGDELARGHQAIRRAPAQQGLHPHHPAAGQIQLGLVVEHQFLPLQGLVQALLQGQAFQGADVHGLGEEAVGVAAALLGMHQGRVGLFQQGVEIAAVVRGQADADAAGDAQGVAVHLEGSGQGGQHRFGSPGDPGQILGLGQDDEEFVAPLPAQGAAFPQDVLQSLDHGAQQLVTGVVAKGVVDGLEVVQVQQQQGHWVDAAGAPLHGRFHRLFQAQAQQVAVGQAGQVVVLGEELQAFLQGLAVRDVGEDGDVVYHPALVVLDHVDAGPLRVDLAALAPVVDFALPVALAVEGLPHLAVEGLVVVARGEQAGIAAQHLFGAVAGGFAEGPVHRADVVVGVGDEEGFVGGVEHLGRQAQFLFLALALGDVHHHPHQAGNPAFGIHEGGLVVDHVVLAAVGVAGLAFVDLLARVVEQLAVGGGVNIGQFLRRQVVHALAQQLVALLAEIGEEGLVAAQVAALSVLVEKGAGDGLDHGVHELHVFLQLGVGLLQGILLARQAGGGLVELARQGGDFVIPGHVDALVQMALAQAPGGGGDALQAAGHPQVQQQGQQQGAEHGQGAGLQRLLHRFAAGGGQGCRHVEFHVQGAVLEAAQGAVGEVEHQGEVATEHGACVVQLDVVLVPAHGLVRLPRPVAADPGRLLALPQIAVGEDDLMLFVGQDQGVDAGMQGGGRKAGLGLGQVVQH